MTPDTYQQIIKKVKHVYDEKNINVPRYPIQENLISTDSDLKKARRQS